MKVQFLGATQTVTGSRYLISHGGTRILIDCGLFRGYKHLRLKNWEAFPVAPHEIDAVLLTHAHLDHSGYMKLAAIDFARSCRLTGDASATGSDIPRAARRGR